MSQRATAQTPTAYDSLEQARERFAATEQAIEDHGGEAVEAAATAYRQATDLLEHYVDRATGTGRENFKAYVHLEGQFATLVQSLPDDLKGREAFEEALDAIDKRRLSESDFERAHAKLEPAAQYAALLDDREAAREELKAARTAAVNRYKELAEEIDAHERLLELSNADLDAPVERLQEPIEQYNEAIREAFETYRLEATAQEVFLLLDRSRWYPFVEYERPPADLEAYVMENEAGEYTIFELLEYTEWSRSKLEHYVADADALKRTVGTQRTYLDGITAGPLTIPWPPEEAGTLRARTREYQPFVARIERKLEEAGEEPQALVSLIRTVSRLTYEPDYDRLQTAATAIDQLTEDERKRLADGRVEADLEALGEERSQLEAALEVDDPV